jgi:GntR family transcriptional regulator/MocR family aminotransferase
VYRERRNALIEALRRRFPGVEVSGIAAGLHIVATLPRAYGPESRFLARAAAAGVSVRPLSDYTARVHGDGRVRLVLGYAHLTADEIGRLTARLG